MDTIDGVLPERSERAGAGKDESKGTESSRLDRELLELLNELRVVLPGVQALFAFLLIVPFNERFATVTGRERGVYNHPRTGHGGCGVPRHRGSAGRRVGRRTHRRHRLPIALLWWVVPVVFGRDHGDQGAASAPG